MGYGKKTARGLSAANVVYRRKGHPRQFVFVPSREGQRRNNREKTLVFCRRARYRGLTFLEKGLEEKDWVKRRRVLQVQGVSVGTNDDYRENRGPASEGSKRGSLEGKVQCINGLFESFREKTP